MYAITGITGKVGGALARELLAAGRAGARSRARCDAGTGVEQSEVARSRRLSWKTLRRSPPRSKGATGVFVLPPSGSSIRSRVSGSAHSD